MDNITLGQLAAYMAFLIGIIGSISYFVKPIKKFSERVDDLEDKRDRDYVRLNTLENDNKMMLRAMLIMLSHMETGNSTNEMKNMKKELETYLINK